MLIESFIPKPVTISDVHPDIPIIVIKNLFLYLNIFLTVTLWLKFKCFHINGILSNKTLFPAFGALGLISVAGVSFNSLIAEYIVAPIMHIHINNSPSPPYFQLKLNIICGVI